MMDYISGMDDVMENRENDRENEDFMIMMEVQLQDRQFEECREVEQVQRWLCEEEQVWLKSVAGDECESADEALFHDLLLHADVVVKDWSHQEKKEVEQVEQWLDEEEREFDDETDVTGNAVCSVDKTMREKVVCKRRKEDYVWGGEADGEDVLQIEKMYLGGYGVYGNGNCKLEVGVSLLQKAGRGVFIKEGCIIRHGECITRYSGEVVCDATHRTVEERLRMVEVGSQMVLGVADLQEGDGFGSLFNSSVHGRTHSFCRFVTYGGSIYLMAHVDKKQYPLRGSMELYITAGHSWWALYNSVYTHND